MAIKRWIYPQHNPDAVAQLRADSGLSDIVCRILCARGYTTCGSASGLLQQDAPLGDPYALRDMDKAVEHIRAAIESGTRIAVYGDYDCDGITSTALLVSYLQSVGADVFYYIPDREREGYGMNRQAVEFLAGQRVGLIVTVDNGISAHEEIAFAQERGMEVVVTDHHTPRDTLPSAQAVVNPHRADDESGCGMLAGVGVAFKLLCALEEDDGAELLEYYSDIVMLGTVADVVPLTGPNRTIVTHGLARLADTERAGLNALLDQAGLAGKALSSESMAFGIIPRLNAAGRMGCVDEAVELLLTDDPRNAVELARSISEMNEQRKEIEQDILTQIDAILDADPTIAQERVIVVAGENWHHGVVGIAAAKVMEKHGKPVILFSLDDAEARGSGRSIEGFSLIEAITACSGRLTRFGGHTLAAGLTLPRGELEAFIAELQEHAREKYQQMPLPGVEIDCELLPHELTVDNIRSVSALEPFGAGNRPPLYLVRNLSVDKLLPTADGKHLRIRFTAGEMGVTAVYFRMTEQLFPYAPGDLVDIVASLAASEYNGRMQLNIQLRDVRLAGVSQDALLRDTEAYACHLRAEYGAVCQKTDLLPTREDVALVYKFLRTHTGYRYGRAELYFRLSAHGITYAKMLVALDVLEELELIRQAAENGVSALYCVPDPKKVELTASRILSGLQS